MTRLLLVTLARRVAGGKEEEHGQRRARWGSAEGSPPRQSECSARGALLWAEVRPQTSLASGPTVTAWGEGRAVSPWLPHPWVQRIPSIVQSRPELWLSRGLAFVLCSREAETARQHRIVNNTTGTGGQSL